MECVSAFPPPPRSQNLGIVHASGTDRDDPDAAIQKALASLCHAATIKGGNAVYGTSTRSTFNSVQGFYVVIQTGEAVIIHR